ncbi:MAG: hypothetical protein K2Y22_04245 [Candidatus Obscuribacterales bacterium]|nr:hypothetical protein [Candidatus Obscuribacterales bacterium]
MPKFIDDKIKNMAIEKGKEALKSVFEKVKSNDLDHDGIKDWDEVLAAPPKVLEGFQGCLQGVGAVKEGALKMVAGAKPVAELLLLYWITYAPKPKPESESK